MTADRNKTKEINNKEITKEIKNNLCTIISSNLFIKPVNSLYFCDKAKIIFKSFFYFRHFELSRMRTLFYFKTFTWQRNFSNALNIYHLI